MFTKIPNILTKEQIARVKLMQNLEINFRNS